MLHPTVKSAIWRAAVFGACVDLGGAALGVGLFALAAADGSDFGRGCGFTMAAYSLIDAVVELTAKRVRIERAAEYAVENTPCSHGG